MITLIARIFDFFMYRLNMSLQIPRMSSLIYTWITRIFDFFMYVQTAYESSDFPV